MSEPVLSPDGKRLAVIIGTQAGHDQLAMIDLDDRSKPRVIASFSDADVASVQWVNDRRVVFKVHDVSDKHWFNPGLFAVNQDGSELRRLIETGPSPMQTGTSIVSRTLPYEWKLHSTIHDGSDDVLVERTQADNVGSKFQVDLARLNTVDRKLKSLGAGAPDGTLAWVVDDHGTPRIAQTIVEGKSRTYWRTQETWSLISESDYFKEGSLAPFHVGRDGTIYVLAYSSNRDTLALHRFDVQKKMADAEPIVTIKGYDLDGRFLVDTQTGKVLGLHYESDAENTVWFDKEFAVIQKDIDKMLPSTTNTITCGHCEESPYLLISSSSDRQPPVYSLFDRKTRRLERVGASRPWIDATQMGMSDVTRFTARDGLSIPVKVTYPKGGSKNGPYPTVVLVHGGPFIRGIHWAWNSQTQFLASIGYAVIEPDFRGSEGYGRKHYRAGWKQWGAAMQDDVADAALWATKEKIADASRMCIAGASYGGYATLMGLVRNPELFRCGIDWVGVTDINLMYSITWSDANEINRQYGMPTLIGDPAKDKAKLAAASPILNAKKITQPLLLAYGGFDVRVPVEHGREFKSAVTSTNKDVEYVEYPTEAHGWRLLETNIDFWTRVDKFLSRNIGPTAAAH